MKEIKDTNLADLVAEAENEILEEQRKEAIRLIRKKLEKLATAEADAAKVAAEIDAIKSGDWSKVDAGEIKRTGLSVGSSLTSSNSYIGSNSFLLK